MAKPLCMGRLILGAAALLLGLLIGGALSPPWYAVRANSAAPVAVPTPASFATPEEALGAALSRYIAQVAPGRRFRLSEARQEGAWAYGMAQESDEEGRSISEWTVGLLAHEQAGGGWVALAPGVTPAVEYNALLAQFPERLLDTGHKAYLRQPERAAAAQANLVGHRLPWPAGQIAYVTQKDVAPYHMNQIDFDILGAVGAGDVYASKPGRVAYVRQDSTDGGPGADYSTTNLVVIEHGPAEFSWYLHLAPNSVPVAVGEWVSWGTKIGIEGATGNATGVHLHYMVSTSHTPWSPNYLPWPAHPEDIVAVDFCEAPWSGLITYWTCHCTYRSTNSSAVEVIPPNGDITAPSADTVAITGTIHLVGWAADSESGLARARFTAYYAGAWHAVGPDHSVSPFSYDWDPCQDGVPEGYMMLGLDIWDRAGNYAHSPQGDREIHWSAICDATPTATPPVWSSLGHLPLILSGAPDSS